MRSVIIGHSFSQVSQMQHGEMRSQHQTSTQAQAAVTACAAAKVVYNECFCHTHTASPDWPGVHWVQLHRTDRPSE